MDGIVANDIKSYATVQKQINDVYIQLNQLGRVANKSGLSDEVIEYATTTDEATASVEKFYASQMKSTNGLLATIQVMRDYNNISTSELDTRQAFAKAVQETNKSLGDELVKLNGANISMSTYAKQVAASTAQTIKMTIAEAALNFALNALVTVGITGLIVGINALINAGEKAISNAKEQAESYNQQIKELSDYNQKIIELRTNLEEGNLSEDESIRVREELISLQDKVNSFYGDEIKNVNTLTSSYDELNKSQKDYVSNSADKWLTDNSSMLDEAQIAYEHFGDLNYFDNLASDIQKLKQGNLSIDEYNQLVKKYGSELKTYSSLIKKWNGEYADSIKEVTVQAPKLAEDLQKLVYDKAINPNYLEKITNKLDESQRKTLGFNYSQSEDLLLLYKTYGEMLSRSNQGYSDILSQIEKEQTSLTAAITEDDNAEISVAKEKLKQLQELVNDYNIVQDEAARLFLNNLIDDSLSKAPNVSDNGEFVDKWVNDINKAFNERFGYFSGDKWNFVAVIVPELKENELEVLLKLIQGEINNKIDWFNFDKEEVKRKITGILGAESFDWHEFYGVRTVDETESTLKDIIDNTVNPLKSAYKTLQEGGTLDSNFFDQFPDLLQYANDADTLKQRMQELINTATESSLKELLLMYNSTDDENIKAVLKQAIELLRIDRDITTEVEDTNDAYAKEKELIQANIDKLTETINKINKKIKKQKEAREALEEEKETLEEQAALYDSAVNAVTRQIDKQIEALERQKAAVEEYYDNQINALKEEAEERDRINELREKELALEKAKNTKVRVYSASRGWTIQTDTEAVNQAQKEYDDLVRNNQIEDLEKEKEAALANYDAQIESWNNYKETWQEAVDAWKNGQDEMNAATVFGKDWREKILSQDLSIVSQYQTKYGEIQDKIKDITDNQLKEIDDEIERLEKKLSVYEELRNDQKEYLDFYKNYSTEFAKATDEQTAALDRFRATLEALNKEGFDVSKLMDMFESYDEMRKYFDPEYDKQGEKYGDKELNDARTQPKTTHSRLSNSAQEKLNRFLNSKLMQSVPTSIGSAFAKSNTVFNGLPTRDYNYAQNKVTNNSGATYNQQRTWVMEGSVIVDSYDKFKEYFDRYVREAKQDLVVGR